MQKQATNLITSVQHYTVAKWRKRDIKHSDEKGRSKIPFIQRQYVYIKLSGICKMFVELRSVLTCLQDTI